MCTGGERGELYWRRSVLEERSVLMGKWRACNGRGGLNWWDRRRFALEVDVCTGVKGGVCTGGGFCTGGEGGRLYMRVVCTIGERGCLFMGRLRIYSILEGGSY